MDNRSIELQNQYMRKLQLLAEEKQKAADEIRHTGDCWGGITGDLFRQLFLDNLSQLEFVFTKYRSQLDTGASAAESLDETIIF